MTVVNTMVTSLALMILLAVTQGAGILLLLPLLTLAGVATGSPLGSGVWSRIGDWLPHSLGALLALYVLIVTARAALEFAGSIASLRVQVEVTRHLRERTYRALVRARWEVVAPLRGARLAHVLTNELAQAEKILREAAASPKATLKVWQNLALVLKLEGKTSEAEQITGVPAVSSPTADAGPPGSTSSGLSPTSDKAQLRGLTP